MWGVAPVATLALSREAANHARLTPNEALRVVTGCICPPCPAGGSLPKPARLPSRSSAAFASAYPALAEKADRVYFVFVSVDTK